MSGRIGYYGGIVKDGLVLNLDAGKKDSYNRVGTVITDISGYGNSGTLTNGPVYDTTTGGSITFDGVDDFCAISNTLSTLFSNTINNITYSFWFKLTKDLLNNTFIVVFSVYTTGYGGGRLLTITRDNTSQYKLGSAFYVAADNRVEVFGNINSPYNTWINAVWLWNGSTYRIFLNGIEVSYSSQQSLPSPASTGSTPIRLAADNTVSNPCFKGQISSFLIYNRVLTNQEVLQNYNALKGRFNL